MQLFVSHADKDNDRIDALCDRLHSAGIETWVDHQNGLAIGDHLNRKILDAVNACDGGLFVLTPNSAASNYCEGEWMRLITLKKPFYVALLDPVPLSDFPLLLGIFLYADLVKDYDAGTNALIRAVGGKIPLDAGDAAVKAGKRITQNYDDRYSTYSIPMQGRDDDLKKALDDLKQAPLFIVGVGGLGKSRLAAEIVRVGDHTGAVWARVSETSTAEEIIRLLREHYALEAITPPEKVIDRVRQDGRLLVVIDNAEAIPDDKRPEFERMADQLALAKAAVIVTTRVMDWKIPRVKRQREPSRLAPEAATRVVQAMADELGLERDTASFAEELAKAARLHPRLIELAVGKLKRRRPDEIIRELSGLMSRDADDALTEMIRKTVAQMESHYPDAPVVLPRLAVCRGGVTFEAAQAIGGIDDADDLDACLSTLMDYNFVRFDGERYSIDDLVRFAVGEDGAAHRAHFDYYFALAQAVKNDQTKHDRYQKLEIESENLDAAFTWAQEADPAQAYWLANVCTDFLANRGRFADLMAWFTSLESRLEGSDDERTRAAFYNDLGRVYEAYPFGAGVDNLRRAIAAYEEALRISTPEDAPLNYATTQNNLGIAYYKLAAVKDRADNLRRAIAAYKEALRFRIPEGVPLDYATTQSNLGIAYDSLADVADRADNLRRAIAAYQQALRFCTPEATPLHYAMTQDNLGVAYRKLSVIEDRADNLRRAIAAHEQALRFLTATTAPLDYAATRRNLGSTLRDSGNLCEAVACWREAEKYYREMSYVKDADKMRRWIDDGEARLGGDSAP